MGEFRDQSFAARFGAMGDETEAKFEEIHDGGFVRFGLNRPPVAVQLLPPFVRYAPDYLTSSGFVECQGVGRDRLLKLKVEKALALQRWHETFDVRLFVWDTKKQQHHYLDWAPLWKTIHQYPIATFSEGKPYWAINIDEATDA